MVEYLRVASVEELRQDGIIPLYMIAGLLILILTIAALCKCNEYLTNIARNRVNPNARIHVRRGSFHRLRAPWAQGPN